MFERHMLYALHLFIIEPDMSRYLALDCEMIQGERGPLLAEVAIVDWNYNTVYHTYVQPSGKVLDYRTEVSGITSEQLTPRSGARSFSRVQKEVFTILQGATLIGHALENDLKALGFGLRGNGLVHEIRNTAHHPAFQRMGPRGQLMPKKLANLYSERIDVAGIQHGSHSAVEDARASMHVYRTRHEDWLEPVQHHGPLLAPRVPFVPATHTNSHAPR